MYSHQIKEYKELINFSEATIILEITSRKKENDLVINKKTNIYNYKKILTFDIFIVLQYST
jgi:hypothetical protein